MLGTDAVDSIDERGPSDLTVSWECCVDIDTSEAVQTRRLESFKFLQIGGVSGSVAKEKYA